MKGTLHWVVAFMAEAEVVIERFDLKRVGETSTLFPVYESRDAMVRLVVSGPGKINAAAATASLAARSGSPRGGAGWINFGIAGCSEVRYAEICHASKVTDGGSGRSWYPVATWPKKADLPRLPLTTVEKPVMDYSCVEGLVEMEAAGFYGIALKQSSVELVQVLKVVSDDPAHPVENLNPKTAAGLCRQAWPSAESWLEAFRHVIDEDARRIGDPPLFIDWCRQFRFSVTEQHQLRRLLQEWRSLSDEEPQLPPGQTSGKSVLRALREQLREMRAGRFIP